MNIQIAKKFNSLIGLVNIVEDLSNKEKIKTIENLSRYGTILKINSEEKTYYTFQRDLSRTSREIRYYGGLAFGRFKVKEFKQTTPYYLATVELLNDDIPAPLEKQLLSSKGLVQELKMMAKTYLGIIMKSDAALLKKQQLDRETSINKLVFSLCGIVDVSIGEKLILLQTDHIEQRIQLLIKLMNKKNDELKIANDMENKVRTEMEKETRNQFSRLPTKEQDISSVIRNQIQGDMDDLSKLEQSIKDANLPQNVEVEMMKEFKRLKSLRGQNAESNVIRTYIETVIELPWNKTTEDRMDLKYAEEILNRDHSGLEIVKKRILEFLAVRFLNGNAKGSIICLVGPPGVGKTSLGKSVAESLNRNFERISLGGVRDEAQVRGHRRTYVGALPGVFINSLKKVKSKNPVILLDEIDKITRGDMRGDPSSALLEVLDPSQNTTFQDHYLAQPFDLSKCMFIATANSLDTIQAPLLDRMEVIQIPGYTNEEKYDIATKYLISRQIKDNGLNNDIVKFEQKAIQLVISNYTREAGVRQLERNIGALCRNVAVQYSRFKQQNQQPQESTTSEAPANIEHLNNNNDKNKQQGPPLKLQKSDEDSSNNKNSKKQQKNDKDIKKIQQQQQVQQHDIQVFKQVVIDEEFVRDVLGVEIYDNEELKNRIDQPGIAVGMAWTQAGGKVLVIECSMCKGRGRIEITGKLGEVMKESVKTALGWIRSNVGRISQMSANSNLFEETDIHVHFPAAAIPKDGPSAGITICTALVSLLTGLKTKENISMTGEITLKGMVLPVGGIKEKCLAAYASGIRTIILPYKNKKDTKEISAEIKNNINFVFAQKIEQVLEVVFNRDDFQIIKDSLTVRTHGKI